MEEPGERKGTYNVFIRLSDDPAQRDRGPIRLTETTMSAALARAEHYVAVMGQGDLRVSRIEEV
jgi:hypothetical protein